MEGPVKTQSRIDTPRTGKQLPAGTPVANPAFDVTPARLVTGIITERGVAIPTQLADLFPDQRRAA